MQRPGKDCNNVKVLQKTWLRPHTFSFSSPVSKPSFPPPKTAPSSEPLLAFPISQLLPSRSIWPCPTPLALLPLWPPTTQLLDLPCCNFPDIRLGHGSPILQLNKCSKRGSGTRTGLGIWLLLTQQLEGGSLYKLLSYSFLQWKNHSRSDSSVANQRNNMLSLPSCMQDHEILLATSG